MPVTPTIITPSVRRAVAWVIEHLVSSRGGDFEWERPNWDGFDFFDKIDRGEIITLGGSDEPESRAEVEAVIYKQVVTFFYHGDPLVWMTMQGIRQNDSETKWWVSHVRYRVCWPSWCDMVVDRPVRVPHSSSAS